LQFSEHSIGRRLPRASASISSRSICQLSISVRLAFDHQKRLPYPKLGYTTDHPPN